MFSMLYETALAVTVYCWDVYCFSFNNKVSRSSSYIIANWKSFECFIDKVYRSMPSDISLEIFVEQFRLVSTQAV